jgi:hypothetical protein
MLAMGDSLAQLPKLKRVILVVKKVYAADLLNYMMDIVRKWFTACPTLTHVDLPQYGKNMVRRKQSLAEVIEPFMVPVGIWFEFFCNFVTKHNN